MQKINPFIASRQITIQHLNYNLRRLSQVCESIQSNPLFAKLIWNSKCFVGVDAEERSSTSLQTRSPVWVYLKKRIGSNFTGRATRWSNLMAILYQYWNPLTAVTGTMTRPNPEPNCNGMTQGGLVSWNCIRDFLHLNPRPCCMFTFPPCFTWQLKRNWQGGCIFIFHSE